MTKIDPGEIPSMRPPYVAREEKRVGSRRWVWGLVVVWLLLGGLGFWLRNETLTGLVVSATYLFFGMVGFKECLDGLRTGVMKHGRGSVTERARNPVSFWITGVVYFGAGVLFAVVGIRLLVAVFFT